ncbi:MAG: rod-binding protein [Bdellovibrionales bacterium]
MIKKTNGPAMGPQLSLSTTGPSAPVANSSGNPELDSKFREVAEMYEKQFLREMTKAMRSTVQESGLVKVSQGERIFREQLDHEYVEKWGNQGGIGLADMIYDQLVFRYGPKAPMGRPAGPMPVDEKSNFTLKKVSAGETGGSSFEFVKSQESEAAPQNVVMPWAGLLHRKLDLGPDETFLEMWHDNGMKSRLAFKGSMEPLQVGQKLQEGESLGYLSPETKNFFWNVSL